MTAKFSKAKGALRSDFDQLSQKKIQLYLMISIPRPIRLNVEYRSPGSGNKNQRL
jgi:hypothetical protein